MGSFIDLTGRRFGRLVVLYQLTESGPRGHSRWRARCDCGAEQDAFGYKMLHGFKQSCGCARHDTPAHNRTHGMSGTNIFRIWFDMLRRCEDTNNTRYDSYGGRGIEVCERWHKFENFYADVGDRPEGLSLDRIDNDGHYSPENCRWATKKQQARNKRGTRYETAFGRTQALGDWADELGIPYAKLAGALKCRTLEEYLSSTSSPSRSSLEKNKSKS